MMLTDALRGGFRLAHRSPGLIVLDILWKGIWAIGTVASVVLTAIWFASRMGGVAWEDTGIPAVNAVAASALFREFWRTNRGAILVAILLLVAASALVWILLEALFRRKMVCDAVTAAQDSLVGGPHAFGVFVASGALRAAVAISVGVISFGLVEAGATVIGFVIFLAVVFLLTLIETLIRADAVNLLGTDLIRVASLLGILMSFELMVGMSVVVVLLVGVLKAGSATDAIAMLGATAAVIVFLNILHSYLLLVRFSAIAIMRRDVIEI